MTDFESIRKRYNLKEVKVATWRDPRGSILPARGGPAIGLPSISADVAAQPFMPTYKVKYRIPEPTDDEESEDEGDDADDDEDTEEPSEAHATREPSTSTPTAESHPESPKPAEDDSLAPEVGSAEDTSAPAHDAVVEVAEAPLAAAVDAVDDAYDPHPQDEAPPRAPSPPAVTHEQSETKGIDPAPELPTEPPAAEAIEIAEPLTADQKGEDAGSGEIDVPLATEPDVVVVEHQDDDGDSSEPLVVEVLPVVDDPESHGDKKVSFAPGTPEPKPTTRKKKTAKGTKSKSRKRIVVALDSLPDDIVAIVDESLSPSQATIPIPPADAAPVDALVVPAQHDEPSIKEPLVEAAPESQSAADKDVPSDESSDKVIEDDAAVEAEPQGTEAEKPAEAAAAAASPDMSPAPEVPVDGPPAGLGIDLAPLPPPPPPVPDVKDVLDDIPVPAHMPGSFVVDDPSTAAEQIEDKEAEAVAVVVEVAEEAGAPGMEDETADELDDSSVQDAKAVDEDADTHEPESGLEAATDQTVLDDGTDDSVGSAESAERDEDDPVADAAEAAAEAVSSPVDSAVVADDGEEFPKKPAEPNEKEERSGDGGGDDVASEEVAKSPEGAGEAKVPADEPPAIDAGEDQPAGDEAKDTAAPKAKEEAASAESELKDVDTTAATIGEDTAVDGDAGEVSAAIDQAVDEKDDKPTEELLAQGSEADEPQVVDGDEKVDGAVGEPIEEPIKEVAAEEPQPDNDVAVVEEAAQVVEEKVDEPAAETVILGSPAAEAVKEVEVALEPVAQEAVPEADGIVDAEDIHEIPPNAEPEAVIDTPTPKAEEEPTQANRVDETPQAEEPPAQDKADTKAPPTTPAPDQPPIVEPPPTTTSTNPLLPSATAPLSPTLSKGSTSSKHRTAQQQHWERKKPSSTTNSDKAKATSSSKRPSTSTRPSQTRPSQTRRSRRTTAQTEDEEAAQQQQRRRRREEAAKRAQEEERERERARAAEKEKEEEEEERREIRRAARKEARRVAAEETVRIAREEAEAVVREERRRRSRRDSVREVEVGREKEREKPAVVGRGKAYSFAGGAESVTKGTPLVMFRTSGDRGRVVRPVSSSSSKQQRGEEAPPASPSLPAPASPKVGVLGDEVGAEQAAPPESASGSRSSHRRRRHHHHRSQNVGEEEEGKGRERERGGKEGERRSSRRASRAVVVEEQRTQQKSFWKSLFG